MRPSADRAAREEARALASRAAERSGVRTAALSGPADTARMNEIVEQIWGVYPLDPDLMTALDYSGSPAIGAEDASGSLVGFALGFPGIREGLHFHSHEAAVLQKWQGRGVGHAIKLAQRAWCLEQGFDEIRWTYDPLLSRNAWLNISRLGGYGNSLHVDFYGAMPDRQNSGDRSDRFELRWPLASARVARALAKGGEPAFPADARLLLRAEGEVPTPRRSAGKVDGHTLVAVPLDYPAVRLRAPEVARAWREESAAVFAACFAAGLAAVAFSRDGVYLFAPRDEL